MEVVAGGMSAAAACVFTNPMEVVKNRLQVQGELRARGQYVKTYRGPIHGLMVMIKTDGLRSVQAGLGPAMTYQFVMNGLRLGTYAMLESRGWLRDGQGQLSVLRCAGCSSLSGVAGAVFGSPIFLVKTHLQTSSSQSIAVGHQHRHTGFISALQHVYQEGGVAGLWRGATASLPRICVGSAAQLVTYSYIEELVSQKTKLQHGSWQSNLAGAILSGFVVAIVINPLDVVSTRLYNQPSQGRMYSNYMDCVSKIFRTEGLPAFYKGLTAQYFRIGPHSFLSLLFWHHSRNILGLIKS